MLDPSTDLRFVAVLPTLHFVNLPVLAGTLIGEVLGAGRLGRDQRLLTGVGAIAIDSLLLPM
ncbi:hypothetical protein D3C81_2146130 [compost metagenome]